MDDSSHHVTDNEWDVVDDLEGESCESFEAGLDVITQKDDTPFPTSLSRSSKFVTIPDSKEPQDYLGHDFLTSVASSEMSPNLTAEQVERAEEIDRMAERAKMNSWIYAGIHINDEHQVASSKPADKAPDEYSEVNRRKLRSDYSAWIFGGVHIDSFHAAWNKLSPAVKEELKSKMPGCQLFSDEQMERVYQGLPLKWCYIVAHGDREKALVIEHSDLANNWISKTLVQRCGLHVECGHEVVDKTHSGQELSTEEYVDVSWVGKDSLERMERFSIAPKNVTIPILVGRGFIKKYSGALMDQNPKPQQLPLL